MLDSGELRLVDEGGSSLKFDSHIGAKEEEETPRFLDPLEWLTKDS